MSHLREVKVRELRRDADNTIRAKVVGHGYFHRWGEEYEEFEAGPGNSTVAIVELDGGDVRTVTPSMIRFLDPHDGGEDD